MVRCRRNAFDSLFLGKNAPALGLEGGRKSRPIFVEKAAAPRMGQLEAALRWGRWRR